MADPVTLWVDDEPATFDNPVPTSQVTASGDPAPSGAEDDPSHVVTAPSESGGLLTYRDINLGTTGVVIKAAPGQMYGWSLFNSTAAVLFVKFYNKATPPTSADTPVKTVPIPAGGGWERSPGSLGREFTLGISMRCSTGVADNDNTAPAANGCVANIDYY